MIFMGKPKFSRKKYETPSHPWQESRIKSENELLKKYGLKNKREIWKAQTKLRNYRGQARTLLAKVREDPQAKKESDQLIMHLTRYNMLPLNSNLDNVLSLETENVLSRRLQTLTYLQGLANTPNQARQLISHGHISISGRKVTVPSYTVTKDEENEISYVGGSPLNDLTHPARPHADFKSPIPVKKEVKSEVKEKTEKKISETEKTVESEIKEKPKETEKNEEQSPTKKVKEQPVSKPSAEKPAEVEHEPKTPKEEKTSDKPNIKEEQPSEETSAEKPKEEKVEEPSKKKPEDKGGN